jgi:hypothetical protein
MDSQRRSKLPVVATQELQLGSWGSVTAGIRPEFLFAPNIRSHQKGQFSVTYLPMHQPGAKNFNDLKNILDPCVGESLPVPAGAV